LTNIVLWCIYVYTAMTAAQNTARLIQATNRVYSRKWSFLAVFLVVFFVTYRIFVLTDFIPNPVSTASATNGLQVTTYAPTAPLTTATFTAAALNANAANASTQKPAATNGALNMNGELPSKVVISKIGLSATIANPATTNVDALDQYLLSGAARYPTSATLDQNGTVVLFGHSSYLPIVNNKAFKTFNGIQNLKQGDEITVYSANHKFTYAVQTVQKESATSGYGIPLSTDGHTLVLATCDSFATKSDRFVVTATLVGSSALGN
jgi:LPXTG-site transpeptidase (sortase) family protein